MNFSVQAAVVALLLFGATKVNSEQVWKRNSDTCPSDISIDENLLSSRVDGSDVVLTGTVVRLIERQERDGDPSSSRKVSGVVRIWRVVKGNLKGISNVTDEEEVTLEEIDNENEVFKHAMVADEKNYPFVKVYGLWNDQMCGSFLHQGETRVFFLKKLQDVRSKEEAAAQVQVSHSKKKSSKKSKKNKSKKTKKDRQKNKKNKLRRGLGKRANKKVKTVKKKREVQTPKKSVLVVNAQPAKINLINLNAIESFSKL